MKEVCQPSLEILRSKCVEWFKRECIRGPLYFPDCDDGLFGESPGDVVNVVFFGSFVRRFIESGNWTPGRYRFWVLCEAARDVLTELMQLSPREVGVIPRYELIPPSRKQREFPKPGERFTLVSAGRISPTKNIELLIRTASFLQTEQKMPVELAIFGRYDNEFHVDRDPIPEAEQVTDFRTAVRRTIEGCEWKAPPRIICDLGPEEWLLRPVVNPVLACFSTFIGEDFGVSVAQAQARGWPCLLSDWGAHRDVRGRGVRGLSLSLIGIHETRALTELKARQLAAVIRRQIEAGAAAPPESASPVLRPRPIIVETKRLDALRRRLVLALKGSAPLIARGQMHRANDTTAGDIFFSKYRQYFSGPSPDPEIVVLVNNLRLEGRLKHVSRACRLVLDEALAKGITVTFLSLQDVNHMDTLSLLLRARKVILPFFVEAMRPLVQYLRGTLSSDVPFSVYGGKPSVRWARRELSL